MSAVIKVHVRCEVFDGDTRAECTAETEGEIDLGQLGARSLSFQDQGEALTLVNYPPGWRASFSSNYSSPGQWRIRCPKH